MDERLFMRFQENILDVQVWSFSDNHPAAERFERDCCFDRALQPMYTADGITYLTDNLAEETFYEITDNLCTNLLLYRFEGKAYGIGPYVKNNFSQKEMQELLVSQHLPASILHSLKLYYERFPQLSYYMIRGTAIATMRTFVPNNPPYSFRKLTGFHEPLKKEKLVTESNRTYAQILQKYEMENYFLRKIREGDVDGVRVSFENIVSSFYLRSDHSEQILYSTNSNGFAIIRTLARKAAEQGGASVVTIDEITQRSIQRYAQARTANEIEATQKDMLIRLTQAVADARSIGQYSSTIRKALGYLHANYAQNISETRLADFCHISPEHLSRTFRKEMGETITDYVTNLRIRKAAELLRDTNLPIAEISLYIGYPDSNYFVKRFRKVYGMPPSAYRKQGMQAIQERLGVLDAAWPST